LKEIYLFGEQMAAMGHMESHCYGSFGIPLAYYSQTFEVRYLELSPAWKRP